MMLGFPHKIALLQLEIALPQLGVGEMLRV
jgi:hypothetical protein